MKKIVALAAITLFGLNSYAQDVKKDSVKSNRTEKKEMRVKPEAKNKLANGKKDKAQFHKNNTKLTPEQRNELRVKKLTLALNLTDKQQKKVLALNNETFKNRPQVKKGEKLTDEQIYQLKSQRLDNQISYKREMEKILSKEQFAQWEKMSQKRGTMEHNKQAKHSKNMQMAQKAPNKVENNKL